MKHTLSILLQNESGALARLAGLFSARHINIDSLSVVATADPAISQLTLVLQGSDDMLEQILRQTRKLIDVLDARTLSLVNTVPNAALKESVQAGRT